MQSLQKVLDNFNIKELNPMQLAAIEASKTASDIVLLSPTGSGKTLGFLLPVLNYLKQDKEGVQVLIIVPSRELALQIEQVFKQMSTGYKVNCCYGGHDTKIEKNNFEEPASVIVGTPGRIAYHIRHESFDVFKVHTVILDEFDKALEFGFQTDMSFIIGELKNVKRRILTSATKMPEIPKFTGIKKPIELDFLPTESEKSPDLKLRYIKSDSRDKLEALIGLICKLGDKSTLVFCNHRDSVDRISDALWKMNIANGVFHGGMEQDERERALIKFRNGSHYILVTTDLASRGLDIPEIEVIIHYQLPLTKESFIHRNGRTARMNAKGSAFLLLNELDTIPDFITDVPAPEGLPGKNTLPPPAPFHTLYIGAGKKDKVNKMDIVGMLLKKGELQKEDLGLIEVLDHSSYVAVARDKIQDVLKRIKNEKIKNKKVKIEISK
jgi:superfamily II DNA/RNA helicase